MENVELPESRQRFGSALIYAGSAIVVVGWIPLTVWMSIPPLITMGVGMLFFIVGACVVTTKVVCPKCGKTLWVIGRATRRNCAPCGTSYFGERTANDPIE